MQEIKLIAIDLDGTLLSSEKTISEANLTALRAAVARGVYVVLASGRSYRNAMDFSEAIAKGQPLICANGAMATLSDPYECVYCECLPKDKLRAAVEILEREKCYYNVYCDDGAVMESRTGSAGRKREANGYAVYRGTVLSGDEMPKYVGDGALKVVCFSPDREKMQRIRSAAERIPGWRSIPPGGTISRSWPRACTRAPRCAALRSAWRSPWMRSWPSGTTKTTCPCSRLPACPWPWATRWRA